MGIVRKPNCDCLVELSGGSASVFSQCDPCKKKLEEDINFWQEVWEKYGVKNENKD